MYLLKDFFALLLFSGYCSDHGLCFSRCFHQVESREQADMCGLTCPLSREALVLKPLGMFECACINVCSRTSGVAIIMKLYSVISFLAHLAINMN